MHAVALAEELKVPFPINVGKLYITAAADVFHEAHKKRFTYRLDTGVQIVN